MTVIELGEVGSEPEPAPVGFRRPRNWRRWAAAGVVLLCALVLGASGLPGPPTVRQVWAIGTSPDRQTTVRDDGIFVHERTGVGRPELVAYEPATGAVRWRRVFGEVPSYMPEGVEAGLLLIPTDEKFVEFELEDGSEGTRVYGGTTIALDAATGAERWRAAGEVQTSTAGTVLLGERTADGVLSSVTMVQARDGSVRWHRVVPGAEQVVVPLETSEPDRIIIADPAGRLTVLRYADGAVLGETRVPWRREEPSRGILSYLTLANDLLLVARQDPTGSEITAHRMDSLAVVWRLSTTPYSYPLDCGPVMCLAEDTDSYGLDPATGRRLWRLPGFASVYPVAEDRLLASVSGSDRDRQILVDAGTGRQVGADTPGWPLRTAPGEAEHLVLLNRYFTMNRSTSSVSRLDLATGRITRIGVVTDLDAGQCNSVGDYLICEVSDRLSVITVG